MANPYTNQSPANFNSNPPPNNNTQTADNQVDWQKHIDKIGTPLLNFCEGVNNATRSAFDRLMLNGIIARTSAYTIQTTDQGKLITGSGTFTISLPAPSVGPNFAIAVKNIGTGGITISAPGSTIDGSSSIPLSAQESAIVLSNGTSWTSIGRNVPVSNAGRLLGVSVFTASGTWTRPTGTVAVEALVVGGGGGSGGAVGPSAGQVTMVGAAGGGGVSYGYITENILASETVTVGLGGAAGNSGGSNGAGGGESRFGVHVRAFGGSGTNGATPVAFNTSAVAVGGQGGAISNPVGSVVGYSVTGEDGEGVMLVSNGAGSQNITGGRGGGSILGGGTFSAGIATQYGTGGGHNTRQSNVVSSAGRAGSSGIVIIKSYG